MIPRLSEEQIENALKLKEFQTLKKTAEILGLSPGQVGRVWATRRASAEADEAARERIAQGGGRFRNGVLQPRSEKHSRERRGYPKHRTREYAVAVETAMELMRTHSRASTLAQISERAESLGLKQGQVLGVVERAIALGAVAAPAPSLPARAEEFPASPCQVGPFDDTAGAVERIARNECRWPMSDPRQDGFRFCCEPVVPGRQYCADHRATSLLPCMGVAQPIREPRA